MDQTEIQRPRKLTAKQDEVELEFVDIDNVKEQGVKSIDLDHVILTDAQKNDLIK